MRKLPAVEDARAVMSEAMDWSVWRWLLEKQRVREIADRATAALDRADQKVKNNWSDDLKAAYNQLLEEDSKSKTSRQKKEAPASQALNSELLGTAKRVKDADAKAERARLDAEETFDEAERQMSASMAREGARKALRTYDLRENAIRLSEAAAQSCLEDAAS